MRETAAALFCILIGSSLQASPVDPTAKPHVSAHQLSRSEGLQLARTAAQKSGFNLRSYVVDTFGGSGKVTSDGKEWLFAFVCSPPEARYPGCEVLVFVNRGSGETKVIPGQ